jgi:hypothetical protein
MAKKIVKTPSPDAAEKSIKKINKAVEQEDIFTPEVTQYSIEKKLLFVKVGSKDEPASTDQIKDIEKNLISVLKNVDCAVFVTHHNVQLEVI